MPTWFTPEKGGKFGGQRLGGVQMIVIDRAILDAPELGLELASAMWKLYRNDWDTSRLIDLLGSDAILVNLKAGTDARCIAAEYQADLRHFMQIRKKYLIYGGF